MQTHTYLASSLIEAELLVTITSILHFWFFYLKLYINWKLESWKQEAIKESLYLRPLNSNHSDPSQHTVSSQRFLWTSSQSILGWTAIYVVQVALIANWELKWYSNTEYRIWKHIGCRPERVQVATEYFPFFHHVGKISPAWSRGRVERPPPFTLSYITSKSCGVRSSWEGSYTAPVSPLPLYVLCVVTFSHYFC